MAQDRIEVGITGLPIPKPRSNKKQYELEKKRRMAKHLGPNVGGNQYKQDVSPYFNPRSIREKTFEEFMAEIFLLTPQPKKKSPESRKPKPNSYGEDPEVTARKLKQKQKTWTQSEMIDYDHKGAEAAAAKLAAAKKAKLERQRSDADAARRAARTTGIPFSDAKGSGFIRNGIKHYST